MCPLCGYQPLRVSVDPGDPSVGYAGGEERYYCPQCDEQFDENEMAKYTEVVPTGREDEL